MAKYLISHPAYVNKQFFAAAPGRPQVIKLPDDYPPSRTWEPLDKAAVVALAKIGVDKKIFEPPAEEPPKAEPDTMGAVQRRTVDRSPV